MRSGLLRSCPSLYRASVAGRLLRCSSTASTWRPLPTFTRTATAHLSTVYDAPHDESYPWFMSTAIVSQPSHPHYNRFARRIGSLTQRETLALAEPAVVVLLTPTIAQRLVSAKHDYLKYIVDIIFKGTNFDPARSVPVYAAVVDRLPAPGTVPCDVDFAKWRAANPPVGDNGFEGISYAVTDASQIRTSPVTEDEGKSTYDDAVPKIFALTVQASPHAEDQRQPAIRIQIPLARTIFQTGQPYTLLSYRWSIAGGLEDRKDLGSISMTYPLPRDAKKSAAILHGLSLPLIPLTHPRQVDSGMGNIIRRIRRDDNSVPASQELEELVSKYFQSKEIAPHSMSVWACVYPEESIAKEAVEKQESDGDATAAPTLEDLWKESPPRWTDAMNSMLRRGARLHRVLSGGGGWGKKAGLLSLEPATDYGHATPTPGARAPEDRAMIEDEDAESPLSTSESGMQQLEDVVKPGEYIQFFVSPIEDVDASPASLKERLGTSIEIGTIPSSIDTLPEPSVEPPKEPQENSTDELLIRNFRNHFGALSENGMSIQLQEAGVEITHTRLDVPYARFSLHDSYPPTQPLTKEKARWLIRNGSSVDRLKQLRLTGPDYPRRLLLDLETYVTITREEILHAIGVLKKSRRATRRLLAVVLRMYNAEDKLAHFDEELAYLTQVCVMYDQRHNEDSLSDFSAFLLTSSIGLDESTRILAEARARLFDIQATFAIIKHAVGVTNADIRRRAESRSTNAFRRVRLEAQTARPADQASTLKEFFAKLYGPTSTDVSDTRSNHVTSRAHDHAGEPPQRATVRPGRRPQQVKEGPLLSKPASDRMRLIVMLLARVPHMGQVPLRWGDYRKLKESHSSAAAVQLMVDFAEEVLVRWRNRTVTWERQLRRFVKKEKGMQKLVRPVKRVRWSLRERGRPGGSPAVGFRVRRMSGRLGGGDPATTPEVERMSGRPGDGDPATTPEVEQMTVAHANPASDLRATAAVNDDPPKRPRGQWPMQDRGATQGKPIRGSRRIQLDHPGSEDAHGTRASSDVRATAARTKDAAAPTRASSSTRANVGTPTPTHDGPKGSFFGAPKKPHRTYRAQQRARKASGADAALERLEDDMRVVLGEEP